MKLDNRLWILVASILCIGLVAGGWFVGVEPRLAAAAAADENRATVEAQNDALRSEIARLQTERDEMPAYEAQLAQLQKSVPPGPYGSQFLAELDRIVTATGVQVESVSIASPTRYEAPNGAGDAAPVPEESDGEEVDASAAPAAPANQDPIPLTDGLISSSNFIIVPVTLTVNGANEQLLAFLDALQSAERLVLVTKVSVSQEAGVEGAPGGASLDVGGDMYVLESTSAAALAVASEDG